MRDTGRIPGPLILSALVVAVISYLPIKINEIFFNIFLDAWLKLFIFIIIAQLLIPFFKLPYWWRIIFLILPLAFISIQNTNLPWWVYPSLFLFLLLLNWNSFTDRVPLYLSNKTTINEISQLITMKNCKKFVDLGSGTGTVIISLAVKHPNIQFTGVESAPLNWLISLIRIKLLRIKNITIKRENIWSCHLAEWDMVYLFLSPAPMDKIIEKSKKESPKECVIISNSFDSLKYPANKHIDLNDKRRTRLLIWDEE